MKSAKLNIISTAKKRPGAISSTRPSVTTVDTSRWIEALLYFFWSCWIFTVMSQPRFQMNFFLKKIFFYYSIVDLNPVNIATLRPSAIVPPTLNVFQYKRRNAKKFQWKPQSSSKKSNVYPFNWTWPNWATHKGIHARDITYHNK